MARSIVQHTEEEGRELATEETTRARIEGRRQWQADLSALLAQAEKRFGDVAWRSSDGETTWAHKALVYARSTGPFQSRYLGAVHLGVDSASLSTLSLSPSSSNLLSPHRGLGILDGRSPSPGASSIASYTPSLSPSSNRSPILSLPSADHALLRPALEVMYCAKGMSEVVTFIFDEAHVRGSWTEEAAVDKLREDLLFMWRSKLYADVQIQILPDGSTSPCIGPSDQLEEDEEQEAVYFTAHRAILVSRCPYFATQLLSYFADTSSRLLTLPASAFTPAALHFLLGAIYCGNLDFSPRHFDLSTGCDILRGAQYLELEAVQVEAEARIADMCHGWSITCCKACARRSARVLRIASHRLDLGAAGVRLAMAARPVVVAQWAEAWSHRDVGEIEDDALRDALATESAASITAAKAVAALGSALSLRGKLATQRGLWVDRTLDMILVVEARVREIIAANLSTIVSSNGFSHLLEGHFFALSREVLTKLLEDLVADLDDAKAPLAYQIITGAVLLREDGLPMDARVLVEEARQGVVRYLKRNWISIRIVDGFELLENWALKEIADELEMPADDLLNPAISKGATTKTGLQTTVVKRSTSSSIGERGPESVDGSLRSSVLNRNAARASVASSQMAPVRRSVASTISTPARASSRASASTSSSLTPPPTASKSVSSPPAPTRAPPKAPTEAATTPMAAKRTAPVKAGTSEAPKRPASTTSVRTTASARSAAPPAKRTAPPAQVTASPRPPASVSSVRSTSTTKSVTRRPAIPATVSPLTSPNIGGSSPTIAAAKPASVTSVRTTRSTTRPPPTPRTPTTSSRPASIASTRTTASVRTNASTRTTTPKKAEPPTQRRAALRASASSASLGTKGKVKSSAIVSPGTSPRPSDAPPLPGTALRVPLPALVSFPNGAKAKAAVHFIGQIHGATGSFVGVCVDEAGLTKEAKEGAGVEWGDGRWGEREYFRAAPGRCAYLRPQQVVFLFDANF